MGKFHFYKQHDSMHCGIACLRLVCRHYGKEYSTEYVSRYCFATAEGVSLLGISEAAGRLGLHTVCGRMDIDRLRQAELPCILHWNQNHFVVLYKVKHGNRFYIADPGKGLLTCSREDMERRWVSTQTNGEGRGIAMLLKPTPDFGLKGGEAEKEKRSFTFLFGYVKQYKAFFGQILLGAFVACLLQLIFPFLTQAVVDIGIDKKDIGLIYLILIGQLALTFSRTAIDFIRRRLLLHISMRINISLVSDFFIKLLRLPMSFFDTKLLGDMMQRMNDHGRVEQFLTSQLLGITFSMLSFVVFGCVLFYYNL